MLLNNAKLDELLALAENLKSIEDNERKLGTEWDSFESCKQERDLWEACSPETICALVGEIKSIRIDNPKS